MAGLTTSVQIELEPGALHSFIGYLSRNVAELTVARERSSETIVALIEGAADAGDPDSPALVVRRFDDERGQPVGDRFVISIHHIERVTVF